MSCITKQSIYRAFLFMDKRGISFRPVDGVTAEDFRSVKARAALCKVWLDALQGLDEKTWDAVINMMLAECKQYPSVEQLYEFIGRVPSDNGITETTPPASLPEKDIPVKKTVSNSNMPKDLQKMFALAKAGRWEEAAACTKAADHNSKLETFAKKYYPAKCSSAWIAKNKFELADLIREEERCSRCAGYHRCNSGGVAHIGALDKYGNISILGIECIKKVKADEKVQ